jgi:hypothetical protein
MGAAFDTKQQHYLCNTELVVVSASNLGIKYINQIGTVSFG